MNCTRIHRLVRDAEPLLPAVLRRTLRRWLAAHAAGCPDCSKHLARLARLDDLMAAALQEEAAAYVVRAPLPAVLPAPRRARGGLVLAVSAPAAIAAAVAVAFAAGLFQRSVRAPGAAGPGVAKGSREPAPSRGNAPAPTPRSEPAVGPRPQDIRRDAPGAVIAASRVLGSAMRSSPTHPYPRAPEPDRIFLDGRDPRLARFWLAGVPKTAALWAAPITTGQDDFIIVPLPRFASTEVSGPQARKAVEEARTLAQAIDARLTRKVTLQLKGASLEDLCGQLERQTGIRISASRGVQDEKATVLLEDRPLRQVMREVARLFGYYWARGGEEGHFTYELVRDLRSQLAEEEMRNQDVHAALLDLDAQMGASEPDLAQDPGALAARAERATGKEKERLKRLAGLGWGGFQLYHRLSPEERMALADGAELSFSGDSPQPDRRISPDLVRTILTAFGGKVGGIGGTPDQPRVGDRNGKPLPGGTPLVDYPGITAAVQLKIDRSEAGQLSLIAEVGFHGVPTQPVTLPDGSITTGAPTIGGMYSEETLALGKSPAGADPDNAQANRLSRADPALKRVVSVLPVTSCRRPARLAASKQTDVVNIGFRHHEILLAPHVDSADAWEAVHRASGLPIVADYYSRVYPLDSVTLNDRPEFDALCQVGDRLGARWHKDGEFILARSTSWLWDKLKEVPARQLRRWRADSVREGGLPFDDLLDMAALSDRQLDSEPVGMEIYHCWDLPEWGIFSDRRNLYSSVRLHARLMATLGAAERRRLLQTDGVPLTAFPAAAVRAYIREVAGARLPGPGLPAVESNEALRARTMLSMRLAEKGAAPFVFQQALGPPPRISEEERGERMAASLERYLANARLRASYVPSGWYVWHPEVAARGPVVQRPGEAADHAPASRGIEIEKLGVVAGRTLAEALAAARHYDPEVTASQIVPSEGVLVPAFIGEDGKVTVIGGVPIFIKPRGQ